MVTDSTKLPNQVMPHQMMPIGRIPKAAILVSTVPFAVGVALALAGVGGEFVFDDLHIVRDNPRLTSLGKLPALFLDNYWGDYAQGGLYRPVTLVSFGLEKAFFGDTATAHHIVNSLLYGGGAALVAGWVLQRTNSVLGALSAGLIFAAHPVHTEAVYPIVGRSELLALIGVLGPLVVAHRAVTTGPAGVGRLYATVAAAIFAVGLFAKESTIVLLPILFLVPLFEPGLPGLVPRLRLGFTRRARIWAGLSLVVLLWFILRQLATGPSAPPTFLNNPLAHVGPLARLVGALEVSLNYHWLTLWPWPLSADYSHAALSPSSNWLAVAGAACWIGILAAVCWGWRRSVEPGRTRIVEAHDGGTIALGIVVYSVPLLLVGNLLFPIGTIFAERLLYLPSAGFAIALGAAIALGVRNRSTSALPVAVAVTGIVAIGSGLFVLRAADWQDEFHLAESMARVQPASAKAHEKFGYELFKRGRSLEGAPRQDLLERARRSLDRSLEIWPDYDHAQLHRSLVALALGDRAGWVDHARRARDLNPESLDTAVNVAQAEAEAGLYPALLVSTERALRHFPNEVQLTRFRAQALVRTGQALAALPLIEELVKHSPTDLRVVPIYAECLFSLGRRDPARAQLDRILNIPEGPRRAPFRRDWPTHLCNRGWMHYADAHYKRALGDFDAALESQPNYKDARVNRIRTLVALGQFARARRDIEEHRQVVGAEFADKLLEGLPAPR